MFDNTIICGDTIFMDFDWEAILKVSPVLKPSPYNSRIFRYKNLCDIFVLEKHLGIHPNPREKEWKEIVPILEEAISIYYHRKAKIQICLDKEFGVLEKIEVHF